MRQSPEIKILNIDDDPAKRYSISRILKDANFAVIEAEDGADALRKMIERPDLVLMDVKLPDIDGFELCRIIKARDAEESVGILHVSATFIDSEHRARGLDSGADAYLNYPVEPEELIATVRALLRLRNAETEARKLATQWQSTFDAIADGIALLDSRCRVIKTNTALGGIFVGDQRPAVGADFPALIEQYFALQAPLDFNMISQRTDRDAVEVSKFGRHFRITIDPIGIDGYVIILTDVTQRKQAEAELALTYQREHRIAETLQRSLLLTPANRLDGMSIETFYEPASDEASVGGDIFDFFGLPDGRVALVVSDAAGKGLGAAACTAEVKFALRAYLSEHLDPTSALTRLNGFLTEQDNRADQLRMIAVALAVVDPVRLEVEFTCAGAEPPLIIGMNGNTRVSMCEGDLPLGAFAGAEYHVTRYAISPGDIILMATDGITEARNLRGEFLGHEGMTDLATRHAGPGDLRIVGESIMGDARSFTGRRFQDDVCLLLARIDP